MAPKESASKVGARPAAEENGQPVKRRPGRPRLLEPSAEHVARREEIIATAAQVFHEKGYDAGTLDDVAEALELRRASLYYYVHSKANLLNMVFERGLDRALADMDELLKIDDPAERLAALIAHQVEAVATDPSLFSVFFDQRRRLEERYEEAIRARERKYLEIYRKAIEAAGAAGVLEVVDVRLTSQAIFGMTTWTYKWFNPKRDDLGQLVDSCIALVLGADWKRLPKGSNRRKKPGKA